MKTISALDPHAVAGALFNVFPENVTPAMIKQVRTITWPLRYGLEQAQQVELLASLTSHNGELEARLHVGEISNNGWPDCPDCQQSATGVYRNIPGCSRCGWSKGGKKDKRELL